MNVNGFMTGGETRRRLGLARVINTGAAVWEVGRAVSRQISPFTSTFGDLNPMAIHAPSNRAKKPID